MKIRTGFVSNSSSSAFILIVKESMYDKAYEKMDVAQKEFCDEFFRPSDVAKIMILAQPVDLAGDFREYWQPSKEAQDIIDEKYDGSKYDVCESVENMIGGRTESFYVGNG